ncbi:DUF5304 domain-containing protein [Streptomyces sp. NPDC050504]|uniref:DUF5304 domain-containing protein n=1 Tax=Streptomyces sp. NPDC050504 TaxID=3365618 RepID=UPI0037AB8C0C
MSEATDRPVDSDAWASACAEDLEAERARRRAQYGPPPGSAAEELRKLAEAVTDKLAAFQSSLPGMAATGMVNQLINQAKSAVEPVVRRNPEVFDHLAQAGGELLAAYRSAVEGHERRWTQGEERATPAGRTDSAAPSADPSADPSAGKDEGQGPGEPIDLD